MASGRGMVGDNVGAAVVGAVEGLFEGRVVVGGTEGLVLGVVVGLVVVGEKLGNSVVGDTDGTVLVRLTVRSVLLLLSLWLVVELSVSFPNTSTTRTPMPAAANKTATIPTRTKAVSATHPQLDVGKMDCCGGRRLDRWFLRCRRRRDVVLVVSSVGTVSGSQRSSSSSRNESSEDVDPESSSEVVDG